MIMLTLKQEVTIVARTLKEAEELYKKYRRSVPLGVKSEFIDDSIEVTGTEEFDTPPADSASHRYKNNKASAQIAKLEAGGASYDARRVLSTSVPPLKELNKPDFEPGQDIF